MRGERERASLPEVALAGYTNAGKSTLLNALSGASISVADRLFHTLDPTTRTLEIGGRTYLMTDTVGFLRKLPHELIDAFGATLEETRRADLLLHVIDASVAEDEREQMTRAVDDVLAEIGAADTPLLRVLNKADLLDADELRRAANANRDALLVSAVTGAGLDRLRERIEEEFVRTLEAVDLLLPYAEGARLAELHELVGELHREETVEGVRVQALVPPAVAARFGRFAVDGRK
jgi:GTP-binding protein HflX